MKRKQQAAMNVVKALEAARELGAQHGSTYWRHYKRSPLDPAMWGPADLPSFSGFAGLAHDLYSAAYDRAKSRAQDEIRQQCGRCDDEADQ